MVTNGLKPGVDWMHFAPDVTKNRSLEPIILILTRCRKSTKDWAWTAQPGFYIICDFQSLGFTTLPDPCSYRMHTYSLQTTSTQDAVEIIGSLLARLADRNDKLIDTPKVVTRFHAKFIPKVSIVSYLNRIQRYTSCGNECLLACVVYLERLVKSNKVFMLSNYNVHRLLIVSVMVASKFFSDIFYTNVHYAKVCF
jgi:hypothetical protein